MRVCPSSRCRCSYQGTLKGLEELTAFIGPSQYITARHLERLGEQCRRLGLDPGTGLAGDGPQRARWRAFTSRSRRTGRSSGGYKYVRADFLRRLRCRGHWLNRPDLPNLLGEGVDLFKVYMATGPLQTRATVGLSLLPGAAGLGVGLAGRSMPSSLGCGRWPDCDRTRPGTMEGTSVHTRMVCEALVAMDSWRGLSPEDRSAVFAAALLHDVGKPLVTREGGRPRPFTPPCGQGLPVGEDAPLGKICCRRCR